MVVAEPVVGIFVAAARLLLALLLAGGLSACETMTYDSGDGPVDAKGGSVDVVDDRNPSDLEYEAENPAVATEEEAWEDAVGDAER
jgi:hypothetical protein